MTQDIWPFWGVRQPVSAGTHFPAFICSIYATLLLCRLCRGDRSRQRAMACYGATLIFQYAASTVYHSVLARPELIHYLRLLDQTAIFALIAGSYTPALYVFIRDPARRLYLIRAIWTLAGIGTASKWLWPHQPYGLTVVIYLTLAASGLLAIKALHQAAGYRGMLWVAYGGIFYVMGTIVDYFEWPALYPGIFAHHELFHLFTMAGTFCHYAFTLLYVVPYRATGVDGLADTTERSPALAFAGSDERE
ncbi:MAG TPA: hemolysin III family protein [Gemmataceae bacterium]|nr:hemolysin III family protein [Gemmataceae bacterium]